MKLIKRIDNWLSSRSRTQGYNPPPVGRVIPKPPPTPPIPVRTVRVIIEKR